MISRSAAVLLLVAAGCGAPPALDLSTFDAAEHRFVAPPAPDRKSKIEELLRKDEITIDEALAIADALNPELEIERKNVDLATAAIWEAKLYPNPSLRLEIEEYKTSGGSFRESKRIVGVGVPIVVSGRLGAAAAAAEKAREIAAVRYVWRRREILTGVRRAFIDALSAERTVALAREARDTARTLNDVAQSRFDAQAVPEMEVLKASVNLATAETELSQALKAQAVAVKALHVAMGDAAFPREKFAGELHTRFAIPSFDALAGQVAAAHPLVEEAMKGVEAADLQLGAAKAERIPDPEIELAAGKDGEDDTIVEGGLTVPIPLVNRNQGKVAAAEIRRRQAELAVRAVRNDLALRLTDAYRTLVSAQERATTYREVILPKAQKALAQTDEGYTLGKFSYLDVLDSQRTLLEAKSAYVAALTDLNLAAAELEKLTGTRVEAVR
jgi:cobalt-zinc-cadmium efflux system outer membrane protein